MASQPPNHDQDAGQGSGPASVPVPSDRATIGWGRAALSGLGLVVLGILVCVYLPNYLVVHLTSLARDKRADLAAIVAVVGVALMAWLLRSLQRRRLI